MPSNRQNSPEPGFTPGQLIIKFKSTGPNAITQCAHCIFSRNNRFAAAAVDGSSSLDQLNQHARVRSIKPVYSRWHNPKIADAEAAYRADLQKTGNRFKKRLGRSNKTPGSVSASAPSVVNTYILEVSSDLDMESLAAAYRKDPHVEYCQPNYKVKASMVPNDPYFHSSNSWGHGYEDLWGLKRMQTTTAWDRTQGNGMIVAVVDTGIDLTHPDIAANIWTNTGEILGNGVDDDSNGYIDDVRGWNFNSGTNNLQDGNGHGTHVSGTIAAIGNNSIGIIGVAPQAKIMPIKALADNGSGSIEGLANAIVYAALQGADVINNSWGCAGGCPSNPVAEEAVRTAYDLGVVNVFAAGNDTSNVIGYSPQNMTDHKPIVVSATVPNDDLAFFSNFGALIDVGAPGGAQNVPPPSVYPLYNILSLKSSMSPADPTLTVGDKYLRLAGTSMASPHVAGLAALVLAGSQTPLSVDNVRHIIRASADDVGSQGFDTKTGTGRVNAAKAVQITEAPTLKISSPQYGSNLPLNQATITITGTAGGAGFSSYSLSYMDLQTTGQWQTISGPTYSPVTEGILGSWNIQSLQSSQFLLRLTVKTTNNWNFDEVVFLVKEPAGIKPLTPDNAYQGSPSIHGDRVVWVDYTNYPASSDIYLHDIKQNTTRALTQGGYIHRYPVIYGNYVMYERESSPQRYNPSVYLYDLTNNTERLLGANLGTGGGTPAISRNRAAWVQFEAPHKLHVLDLDTNQETLIPSNHGPRYPGLDGSRVVFERFHPIGSWGIDYYDMSIQTGQNLTADYLHFEPKISGNRIVWYDNLSQIGKVHLYDLHTNTHRLLTSSGVNYTPTIAGNTAAWATSDLGDFNINIHDFGTETAHHLTLHPSDQYSPSVSGRRTVWTDERGGNPHIYMHETPPPAKLQYYPLPKPMRLLDTRPGTSACYTPGQPLTGGQAWIQQAQGVCSEGTIPSDAQVLAGNITVIGPAQAGSLTVYPGGTTLPNTSSLNYGAGQIIGNFFTTRLASDGTFNIRSYSTTHAVVDVVGYYAPPSAQPLYYHPLPTPLRLLDTRPGMIACQTPGQPLTGNQDWTQQTRIACSQVPGQTAIPSNAQALAGKMTVVAPAQGGYVVLSPGGTKPTITSNLNYGVGQIAGNFFTTRLGSDGTFDIRPTTTTHMVVDVVGYYSPDLEDANGKGSLFVPLPYPMRLLDTRTGTTACDSPNKPLQGAQTRSENGQLFCGDIEIPTTAAALQGNATVVSPSQMGYLTLHSTGGVFPTTSNLNYEAGQVIGNFFTTRLGSDGKFNIMSTSNTELVIDVTGYYE